MAIAEQIAEHDDQAQPGLMSAEASADVPDSPTNGDASQHPAARARPSLRRLFTVPERMSHEAREAEGAQELSQAMAFPLNLLSQAVPEAGTPEEAARLLAERQGELVADPAGGSEIHGDRFDTDRRVYYRLLNRDYQPRNPRAKKISHKLHDRPALLPGTRGW
ncbi:MAG: hypothetical protein ACT4OS_09165 [Acidimicrobiales bacterium]